MPLTMPPGVTTLQPVPRLLSVSINVFTSNVAAEAAKGTPSVRTSEQKRIALRNEIIVDSPWREIRERVSAGWKQHLPSPKRLGSEMDERNDSS